MRYILAFLIIGIISCSPKNQKNSTSTDPAETTENTAVSSKDTSAEWENVEVIELKEIGYYPAFLPTGSEIIYSTSNYQGLWIYDMEDESKTEITTARGAGYHPQFKDGSIIYEVKSKKTSYESFDLKNKKSTVLSDVDGTSLKAYASNGPVAVIASDLNSIHLYEGGKVSKSISPAGYKNIVNASVSPNGRSILLEVSGKGGFIVDLDGKLTHNLGDLDKPSWINDHEIVYSKIGDDGMKTTSGEIFIKNINTQKEYAISAGFSGILQNPTSNNSGDQIIANSPDGKIILISKN